MSVRVDLTSCATVLRFGKPSHHDNSCFLGRSREGSACSRDVDYLGDGEYAIADKDSHRVFTYKPRSETITWEYRFAEHFPASAGGGIDGDYTHLNDIDAVAENRTFLVSPRNFDQVMLINRSTKDVELTLGQENNHTILYEQHNPVLLSQSPPTILVADSENNRVVEYARCDGAWVQTWAYDGDLAWPRDADRLPNGNTLIVDTHNQRVVEVSPNGTVVWEVSVPKMPYDVERLRFGDEAQGPPMAGLTNDTATVSPDDRESRADGVLVWLHHLYHLSLWLLPVWVGFGEFLGLLGAGLVVAGELGVEIWYSITRRGVLSLS